MRNFFNTFLLLGLPLYAVLSLSSMAGMNIGFLILFLSMLAGVFLYGKTPFRQSTPELSLALRQYARWAIALFIACVISLVVAHYYPFAYAGRIPDVTWHGYQKSWYLICPFILITSFRYQLAATALAPEERFAKIIRVWWASVIFLSVISVIQFNTGWPLKQDLYTNPGKFHAILWLGHHLSVASILIFPTFTALAIVVGNYTRSRQLSRFELLVGLCGILCLFLSYARAAWIAIPLGLILLFARYLSRSRLILSVVALLILMAGFSQTSLVKDRIYNSVGVDDRVQLWIANIDYFKHRPITGIGWLKTQEMSEFYFKERDPELRQRHFWGHAHNNFFEMLGGTGILGVLAFLGWSYFTFRLAFQTSKRARENGQNRWADFSWGLFVGLILLHFNGMTNVTFWEGKVMHQQMLAIGMLLMLQLFVIKKPTQN